MAEPLRLAVRFCHHRVVVLQFNDLLLFYSCSNRFIGLSVFGNGWAVVTGVAPASATHPLRYNMCSNVEMHTSSTPRQHPNTNCRGCFTTWGSELTTNVTTPPPLSPKSRVSKMQRHRATTKHKKAKNQATALAHQNNKPAIRHPPTHMSSTASAADPLISQSTAANRTVTCTDQPTNCADSVAAAHCAD